MAIIQSYSVFGYYVFERRDNRMRYSNAQQEATARYNKKKYDRIAVVVPKGKRQILKDLAASQGKSLNRFITEAIEEKLKSLETE